MKVGGRLTFDQLQEWKITDLDLLGHIRGHNHPRGAVTAPASKGQQEDKHHRGLEFLMLPGQTVPSGPWLGSLGCSALKSGEFVPPEINSPSVMTFCCGPSCPTCEWQILFKSFLLIYLILLSCFVINWVLTWLRLHFMLSLGNPNCLSFFKYQW